MKKASHLLLFSALLLVLFTAACGAEGGVTPTSFVTLPVETSTLPGGDTTQSVETPTASTAETAGVETPTLSSTESVSTLATSVVGSPAVGVTQTPGIPVTGVDIVLVECQFCIDGLANALLVLPDTATFAITTPTTTTSTTAETINTSCSTIEVNNGKQVVLCSGAEMTPIMLNICTDANTCTDFPIDLLPCPLAQSGTVVPNETQPAPGTEGNATPSATATP